MRLVWQGGASLQKGDTLKKKIPSEDAETLSQQVGSLLLQDH